ncbi:MAG TPA: TetR/AcrR family transcriptional regulator [Acetobacteraceae bacterium]|nr:TetR/AcrR family transcriptional regulator [Acetobacteraceae bacterium]
MTEKILPAKPQPYHHGDLRHALVETALLLVTEEQDWTFSLREVARRAGVSHRAPYNHFPEKLDLLAAVAAVGFERLRDGMLRVMVGIVDPEALLFAITRTYIRLGLENPALYRLMFGPALSAAGSADRPPVAKLAGAQARGVLEDVILRGARSGAFAVSPDGLQDVALTAISVWSATHGLTMLALDKITRAGLSVDDMIERLLEIVTAGLKHAHAAPSRQRQPPRQKGEAGALSASPPGQMVRRKKGATA